MKFNEKQSRTNPRVGIFVVISLVILILGYLWFTNYLEKGSLTKLTVIFPDAFGLELGDGVLILGVSCGKVTALDLAGDKVLVSMSIKLQEPLKTGTEFSIRNTSLMGSTRVIINPGLGSDLLDLSAELQGTSSPGISALTAEAGTLLSELNQLLAKFNSSDNIIDKYSQAADTLQLTFKNLNQLITQNQENLSLTIANLAKTSSQIADLITRNQQDIDSTLAGSDEFLADLTKTSSSFRELAQQMLLIARQLRTENSTFAELTTNDELYKKLLKSTASLDSLLVDIKKNPKKYLTVKIF